MNKCMLCDKKHYGKGFCQNHYNSYRTPKKGRKSRKGIRTINNEICFVELCDNKVYAKNLCKKHYGYKLRTGRLEKKYNNKCAATNCIRIAKDGMLFCITHQKRYEKPRPIGINNYRWNGGRSYFNKHYLVKKHRKILIEERGSKCQECGIYCSGIHLQQHHIDGNKNNHIDTNIKLLCFRCHAHTKKGMIYKNGNTISNWSNVLAIKQNTLHRAIKSIRGDKSHLSALFWLLMHPNLIFYNVDTMRLYDNR